MAKESHREEWDLVLSGHDWNSLLRTYRENPSPATSEPLLRALEPIAAWSCSTLKAAPPAVQEEDVRQQFTLALLEAALQMKPQAEPRWTPIRLVQRAHRSTWKWLLAQQTYEVELSAEIPAPDDVEDAALELLARRPDDPIYRRVVLGESYALQARKCGVTAAALRQRVSRRMRDLASSC